MEILGIGPLELFFIVIIALIVLGPKDMVKAGRSLGRLLRRTILSPTWLNMQRKVRELPYHLMREAGIEDDDLKIDIEGIDPGFSQTQPRKPPVPENQSSTANSVPKEWLQPARHETNSSVDVEHQENEMVPKEWLTPQENKPNSSEKNVNSPTLPRSNPKLEETE